MTEHARVVIVGGAIAGAATAHHLARLGWRDILVVEQGPFPRTGGSTSHAPGNVFQGSASPLLGRFAGESIAWYRSLRLDGRPVFAAVGGIELARSERHVRDLKRRWELGQEAGLDGAVLQSPAEAAERHPLLDPGSFQVAHFMPQAGLVDGIGATEAAILEAGADGAVRLWPETEVTGIAVTGGRVTGVETTRGTVTADAVVLAAGIWGPKLGAMAGVPVPLAAVDHQGLRVGPLPELAHLEGAWATLPVLRYFDVPATIRQWHDHVLIGNYRRSPRAVDATALLSHRDAPEMPSCIDFRPEETVEGLRMIADLLPATGRSRIDYGLNGLFCFTPDGMPLLGPTAVQGLWLCEAVWLTHAPAAAGAVARWIVEGDPGLDLSAAVPQRFSPEETAAAHVREMGLERYRTIYDLPAER